MNTIFANLNINVRIIKVYIRLNTIFDNIFNNNSKDKHKLLNMFKKIVNNNDERMRFRNKIE